MRAFKKKKKCSERQKLMVASCIARGQNEMSFVLDINVILNDLCGLGLWSDSVSAFQGLTVINIQGNCKKSPFSYMSR